MGKVIGVLSLKGGVGKTSTVAALGAAIADFGKKVLLIDGNLSSPNLGLHLNVLNPEITLHHVLNRTANIKDAVYNLENFDMIPSSLSTNLNINPLKLKDKIKNIKRRYDFVVIDSSPSLGEETLAVILASDELFVITTPDYPTLSSTLKAVRLARQRGTPINGIVLNKVYNKDFELPLDYIEEMSEIPIMAVIPYDVNVLKALSNFTTSVIHKPKSEGSQEYKKLAASLIGEEYKPVKLKSLFRWVNPRKQDINRTIFYERVFKG